MRFDVFEIVSKYGYMEYLRFVELRFDVVEIVSKYGDAKYRRFVELTLMLLKLLVSMDMQNI